MREILAETIADLGKATQLRRDHLSKEIFRLEAHEENRQDLVADGGVSSARFKVRLNRIDRQRQTVERELATVSEGVESGIASIERGIKLLEYLRSSTGEWVRHNAS
jgi:hypothetical protein